MLEAYMSSIGEAAIEGEGGEELPTRAEDVDKFMAELAAAASGGKAGDELEAAKEEQ